MSYNAAENITSKNTKSYANAGNAQKAVDNLEHFLRTAENNDRIHVGYMLQTCPESGRFIPVILKGNIPEHLIGGIAHSGFTIVG